jgi:hydroxyethylthiazole kinase-like uncharacterized protein yjeF
VKVATSEQMRAIDQAAVELGLPSLLLMENAGAAVAEVVREVIASLGGSPSIVVVAGKGNNGGDGLVAARHLYNRGHDVSVCLLGAGEELRGDAAINLAAAQGYGVEVVERCDPDQLAEALAGADIVVDALFGTGLRGEVRGPARQAIETINAAEALVIAVDLPSGVEADTGAVWGVAVEAHLTVALGLPKVGNVVYPGAGYGGELRIADISLPPSRLTDPALQTNLITPELAAACLPSRRPDMHKGEAGRVLIIAGARGYTGAAALAAHGALRAGAGLVYLATPTSLNPILEVKCTEAITLPMPETQAGSLAPTAAAQLVELASSCDAVALGPGLSRHPETARLVAELVARLDRPLVVDADGLNCLADTDPTLLAARSAPTVLTPHPGELARLLKVSVPDISADRLGMARRAAHSFGAVTVLKGAGTIVARADGEAWINPVATDALASGGTGDVLTGVLAAFLAGSASPEEAAIAAVYYHARAGELAARRRGATRGVLASDLLAMLGRAFGGQH